MELGKREGDRVRERGWGASVSRKSMGESDGQTTQLGPIDTGVDGSMPNRQRLGVVGPQQHPWYWHQPWYSPQPPARKRESWSGRVPLMSRALIKRNSMDTLGALMWECGLPWNRGVWSSM